MNLSGEAKRGRVQERGLNKIFPGGTRSPPAPRPRWTLPVAQGNLERCCAPLWAWKSALPSAIHPSITYFPCYCPSHHVFGRRKIPPSWYTHPLTAFSAAYLPTFAHLTKRYLMPTAAIWAPIGAMCALCALHRSHRQPWEPSEPWTALYPQPVIWKRQTAKFMLHSAKLVYI